MRVSTAEFAAMTERPVFEHRGRSVVGGFLSIEEFFAIVERLDQERRAPNTAAWRAIVRDFFDAVFPPPARWQAWRLHVARVVLAMPRRAQSELLDRFFVSQADAIGARMTPPATLPIGTNDATVPSASPPTG